MLTSHQFHLLKAKLFHRRRVGHGGQNLSEPKPRVTLFFGSEYTVGPTGRKKTYKEVKAEKQAAYIMANIKELRQAKTAGNYEMMEIGDAMTEMEDGR